MNRARKDVACPETLGIPVGPAALIEIDNGYNPPRHSIWGVRIEGLE
jgi:hypothetical protein